MFSVESIVGGARGFASQRLADIERRPDDAGGAWAQRPKQSSQSFTAMTGNRRVHATIAAQAPTPRLAPSPTAGLSRRSGTSPVLFLADPMPVTTFHGRN